MRFNRGGQKGFSHFIVWPFEGSWALNRRLRFFMVGPQWL